MGDEPLIVRAIRDARPAEAAALAALQRRSSDVWEEYRDQLAANPGVIEPPHRAIAEGRVRVAVDAAQRRLGFSVVLRRRAAVSSWTTSSSSRIRWDGGSAGCWSTM